jgi:glycosyltransferase involved in cell wall biosynthesis
MRLAIFATHPIQYQAPLWRRLAETPGMDVTVYYFSDRSVNGGRDPDFGVEIKWDVPLLQGYAHEYISRDVDLHNLRPAYIPDAQALLKHGQYDWALLQGYTCRFERQVIREAAKLGVKVLLRGEFSDIRERGRVKSAVREIYLKWFYDRVHAFCYIGEDARQHLLRRGIPEDRMTFSPYCVDTDFVSAHLEKTTRDRARSELGLKDGEFTFLFSGKLVDRKQPLALIEAISRMPDRRHVALIVMGDGPLREAVIQKGKEALGSRFHFMGFVNQTAMTPHYLAADALVLPSKHETWGLVVNEAMQCGLPVVVSDRVGCGRDLVVEGETGYVYPSGDVESLAQCLEKLVADPEWTRGMGRNARQIAARYTIDAAAEGILQAIGAERPAPALR